VSKRRTRRGKSAKGGNRNLKIDKRRHEYLKPEKTGLKGLKTEETEESEKTGSRNIKQRHGDRDKRKQRSAG
jgi:hypothetical protein